MSSPSRFVQRKSICLAQRSIFSTQNNRHMRLHISSRSLRAISTSYHQELQPIKKIQYCNSSPILRWFSSSRINVITDEQVLKKDFIEWAKREAGILTLMLGAGITGVYFYQNRENAPSKKVVQLIDSAAESAKQGNRDEALKYCLQAYSLTKGTNSRDRHLFQLAFGIAAQYETLEKVNVALKYYMEALSYIPYTRDQTQADVKRLVTLDRIAQCFQDKGEQETAEKYYLQAVDIFQMHQDSGNDILEEMELEASAVLFNYGQQLVHLRRWDEARPYLLKSLDIAERKNVAQDRLSRLNRLLDATS